jgi:hypothetical protein
MSVLNERLKLWAESQNVITDAQFGFKSKYSTVDAIFAMHSFIQKQLNEKKKLYCCFVDFQKCFDTISRNALWFKLLKHNINGKLIKVIRSMYDDIQLCVKHANNVSDFFSCKTGLLQGEINSPILYSLFMNDVELFLQDQWRSGFTFEELMIFLVCFADDSVLLSETAEGLQNLLNSFETYCIQWKLKVNVQKTKIVVFKKGGRNQRDEEFRYNGQQIEIVNNFNYLGFVLTNGGSFYKGTKTLADKALRSMGALLSMIKGKELTVKTVLSLFDSFVSSILSYSCEVWGVIRRKSLKEFIENF